MKVSERGGNPSGGKCGNPLITLGSPHGAEGHRKTIAGKQEFIALNYGGIYVLKKEAGK